MSKNDLEMMSAFSMLMAINRLLPELPDLLGVDAWIRESQAIKAILEQLCQVNDEQERAKLASQLVITLNKYEHARTRLKAELHIQANIRKSLDEALVEIGSKLGLSSAQVASSAATVVYALDWTVDRDDMPSTEDLITRGVTLKEGGLGGAKSIKFSNMNLDIGEATDIVAGTLLSGYAILDKPHPFLIAAGVLLMFRGLHKAMAVQITERDASVFWGFIQARNPQNNEATELVVLEATNRERKFRGLTPLKKSEFRNALVTLESLKCIATVADRPKTWRITEKYRIKS